MADRCIPEVSFENKYYRVYWNTEVVADEVIGSNTSDIIFVTLEITLVYTDIDITSGPNIYNKYEKQEDNEEMSSCRENLRFYLQTICRPHQSDTWQIERLSNKQ
jgi:hypothetical protein